MAYRILLQIDSARWRHYIDTEPGMSLEYSREHRYIKQTLHLVIEHEYIYIYSSTPSIGPGMDAEPSFKLRAGGLKLV